MTHVIFDPCIRDGACADICPVTCIVAGQPEAVWPWFYVDPDACIDCGDCVSVCPVDAICPAEQLPQEYAAALALNARFFRERRG
jgi:ferredoxin--NADP+ reductase